ncbi:MAG: phosphoglucomutase/phosphomannomutase family protein [Chloroflexi bacterium]|nr:phosphoglucomutase/phosphomannomutase family protein [Chloroflexota bacterium]
MPTTIQFGTDGWRALIAEDYTFDNVRIAAQATAQAFIQEGKAERRIVVGFDTRFASDRFARAVVEVLAANGVKVLLSDRFQPTPVISYSVIDKEAGGAIIITSSHNPASYNGFKVKSDVGASASPELVAVIEQQIEAIEAAGGLSAVRRMPFAEAVAKGLVEAFDATPAYDAQIARLVDLPRLRDAGFNVVADAMFGTGMGYFKRLLAGGRTTVHEIRAEINPSFPGIAPEPIRPHIDELSRVVREMGADVGLATDGDSDRIGAVTGDGTFVNQHQVFGLLLLYLMDQRGLRGPAVRSVTMTSMGDAYAQRLGQEVIETAVGFKFVGNTMVERNAVVGGEESGGFGFSGHIPERDAIVAGLYLLDLMVRLGTPMSGAMDYLRQQLGDWYYHRVDVSFPPDQRQAILERVGAARPNELSGSPVASVGTKDGYKFYAQDGSWLLIRFSGTEPLLRIYTETTSQERVARILDQGRRIAGV